MKRALRKIESLLRRLPVGRRLMLAVAVLVVPMTVLIVVSVSVLERQETRLQRTVDEAVTLLVPLATLEYDLQRALTDALAAETGEAVPDYGGLTGAIDRLFAQLAAAAPERDRLQQSLARARSAWQTARPAIAGLVEETRPLHLAGDAPVFATVRQRLTAAIDDLQQVQTHLSAAIQRRAALATRAQQRQLEWLVGAWGATLLIAAGLFALIVLSIVRPVRDLGRTVQRLGEGDLTARADTRGGDELGTVAGYLNAMTHRFATWRRIMEDAANQDALTGLPNRRAILAALEAALASSAATQTPVGVLMIDVDHFKQINDQYGHVAGDRALAWIAGTLRGQLRSEDHVGRYAGDEFLAVLPGSGEEETRQIAERLCEQVRQAALGDPRRPTLTIGVAASHDGETPAEALIEIADRALYRGKQAGRGRVAPS
ncbi:MULTISPECIES: diguanylate cyclase [Modicisalibacter]|uniref:GGDEF domain-containing protein n=1 Tax=Modicisalibacter TaxID=574347 RepID=UPI00100B3D3B|nr:MULTISPECIES: diguanylate cyclase [Halomonadaceae]MBZ9557741.1 diguanylate cyclase [Modicisalibacter sp. R2A 31.J]MBZ9573595.1 diguanylate cyclase [Modicisalibacter sp. MOD 31.J]